MCKSLLVGFRLRLFRSKKFGPFRFTLSKRGIGASAGVPGARYSVHSSGRTTKTVGVPGTGISWREQKTRRKGRRAKKTPAPPPVDEVPTRDDVEQ